MAIAEVSTLPPRAATVRAEHVSYRARRGAALVRDASLDVEAGERVAIIGPNGAGKTTLLRIIAGQLRPTAGRVMLDGLDIAKLGRQARARRVAVMAQSDRPDLRLRGIDYVALGRLPYATRTTAQQHQEMVMRALEAARALSFADRPLSALSGGERQRLMLARALAQQPAVLLLDEPTNNLDPRARLDLLSIVADLGITVIAVLHDLALAPDFADRVAVMAAGRIVLTGPPQQALSTEVVRDVFDLQVFPLSHPRDGRPLFVFDTLVPKENAR
ncbi:MAG: ABC transporter ATP-binding protein [Pseudomonadota bacterium]